MKKCKVSTYPWSEGTHIAHIHFTCWVVHVSLFSHKDKHELTLLAFLFN